MQQTHTSPHLNYLLYLPKGHDAGRTWPLILFLHGSGERGDDLELVKNYGLPSVLEGRDDLPFVIVSPQCPANVRWVDIEERLMALLGEVSQLYNIDPQRIFLTGLSMGGQGVWHVAAHHPERFAAIAPMMGRIPPEDGFVNRICVLQKMPVWVFHGEMDDIVPVEHSRILAQALEACGGKVRLTVYPYAGHNASDLAYADDRLYAWFMMYAQ